MIDDAYVKELEERVEELEEELQKKNESEDDSMSKMDSTGIPIHRKIHSLDEIGPHSNIWLTISGGTETWKLLKVQKSQHNGNIVMIMERTEIVEKYRKKKIGWFRSVREPYTDTKIYYSGVKGTFDSWAHFPYSTGYASEDTMSIEKVWVCNAFWRVLEEMGAPLERP
jgi:hypothetical protein